MIRQHASSKLRQTLLCAILVLCTIELSLSSSPSASSSTSIISTKSQQNDKPNKRTIVSGFGAHSTRKSIFALATSSSGSSTAAESQSPSPKKASKKQQSKSKSLSMKEESSSIIGDFDFSSNALLVYKQDKKDDDDDDDSNNSDVRHTDSIVWLMDPQTNQKLCIWVNENGDWTAELVDENAGAAQSSQISQPKAPKSPSDMNGWAPVEGIYGFYKVPTGILLVLIAKTRNIFRAPPLSSATAKEEQEWWKIDKVQQLEVVHLSNAKAQQGLSPIQIKEEIRQLRLLRKAWKQHDFYCCQYDDDDDGSAVDDDDNDKNDDEEVSRATISCPPIVRDMTKSLQSSFLAHQQQQQQQQDSNKRSRKKSVSESQHWWTANPDPRFFWNQAAVEPILAKGTSEGVFQEEDPSRMDPWKRFLLDHTIPLTSAFVGIQSGIACGGSNEDDDEEESFPNYTYTQLLISRRSRFRAGTRFTRRGADANGAVANYAETEQVLLLSQKNETSIDKIASHVQTRGSIPIRWSSPADVKTYRPKVHIGTDPLAQARALRWHLLEQQAHYVLQDDGKKLKNKKIANRDENESSEMVFVNLVDKKSDQGRLGKAFDEVLQAVLEVHNNDTATTNNNKGPLLIKHVWYDFHAEVKNGKWDRLSFLLKDMEPSLRAHNYFVISASNAASSSKKKTKTGYQIESKQSSVVRTNCMDCLDRTNVVQSILGRFILFEQLVNNPILTGSNKLAKKKKLNKKFQKTKHLSLPWPQSEKSHRALWADNADEISRLYAGTPALKRDFTRTGQRTKLGALDDGVNSLQRYYLNNFMDADRQEGMDLMVGYASFTNTNVASNRNENEDKEQDKEEEGNIFATRRSFLGGRFPLQSSLLLSNANGGDGGGGGGDPPEEGDEEENDNNNSYEDAKDALDLRWVPGDLQEHFRSRAEETSSSDESSTSSTSTASSRRSFLPKLKFDFSSTRALKAMDERSTSDLPWWSLEEKSNDDDNDATIDTIATAATATTTTESSSSTIATREDPDDNWVLEQSLAPHQRHRTLSRGNVMGVLLLGFRAPMQVAMGMVLLLGFLYLQEICMHDWKLVGSVAMKLKDYYERSQQDAELEEEEEEYEMSDDAYDEEEEKE
ncbi:MAG: hypothetical protein SGBAC_007098 [Bacillariaceae sp.]